MENNTAFERPKDWRNRIKGLVSESIGLKNIAVVGCGSVGSYIADKLARCGIKQFTLIDPDVVEWPNLSRTVFGHNDIGSFKVNALSQHLKNIFPDINSTTFECEVQTISDQLPTIFKAFDLVVAAVDDPRGNGLLDRLCYSLGVPVVFVGIYKGAKGGEVIAVNPSSTPCFGCATGGTREVLSDLVNIKDIQRDRDYGTNKLMAEVALGSDIHFVCNAAVKICLSMLSDSNNLLYSFANDQIKVGVHYLMLGMEPSYYIFPSTHKEAIGQHAFQSLWLQTTRRDDCPRCGVVDFRIPYNINRNSDGN
jgi:hypothetical protein